jgi:hypothetical protein
MLAFPSIEKSKKKENTMRRTKQFNENSQVPTFKNDVSIFDEGPEEPKLCALSGYDDCQTCYFRLSTVKRITRGVKQLHPGRRA